MADNTFSFEDFEAEDQDTSRVPESTTGFTGVGQDIYGLLQSFPELFMQGMKALPGELSGAATQLENDPRRAYSNLGGGLLKGGRTFLNIPSYTYEYLGEKGAPLFKDMLEESRAIRFGPSEIEKTLLGENEDMQPGDALLRGLPEFLPFAKIGAGVSGAKGIAKRAGGAGLYGTGSDDSNPVHAALMGMAPDLMAGGSKKIYSGAKRAAPSSPLNAEQLKEAARVTQGTQTPLGNVIDNPTLKRTHENIVTRLPFSGAEKAAQKTAAQIESTGKTILDDMIGDINPADAPTILSEGLKNQSNAARLEKNRRFDEVNKAADNYNVTTDRANSLQAARDIVKKATDDPGLSSFSKSPGFQEIVEFAKSPKKEYSLRDTDFLRGKVGQRIDSALKSGDDAVNELSTLKKALEKDIESAIENSGIPELKAARRDAMDWYKENYAPFKDKEIRDFTVKGKDPDLLAQTFIKTSQKTDRGNLLNKLQEKLPPDQQALLAFEYFSPAIKEAVDGSKYLDPKAFSALYSKLGDRQKSALLRDPAMSSRVSDFVNLARRNPSASTLLHNPPTGQTLKDMGAVLGVLGGGHFLGLPPAVSAGAIGLGAGFNKLMTSPGVREALIKRMIENIENPMQPGKPGAAQTGLQSALVGMSAQKKGGEMFNFDEFEVAE